MRHLLAAVAAASMLAVAAPASAQFWQSINQRQAYLDARIDAGVRSGELTRTEAARLRGEFYDLARLESRYRYSGGGLTWAERRDLDRRFDLLAARIRYESNDGQDRGWQSIDYRQRMIDARIDAGLRSGHLSRHEAYRLRAEFNDLRALEARYRYNGLSAWERADLDRRFDRLEYTLQAEWRDRDNRYG